MNITKKNNIIEIICFLIFCIITIFVSFFHEPWFDEMQAWGISCDSLYNILFVIPHLEGHPPLWHLILKCFSVFGINPEIGLKISNLSFMILSIWLLIFKSPFPKYVKLLLPFTYFLFYQYSIVNRPYSILCFFLFLSAYLYPTRNIHPYKFIFSLMGLSLSSVYGMVFAVGITIYWLIEIIKEQKNNMFTINFFKDSRILSTFLLAFVCLLISTSILPNDDVYAFVNSNKNDYIVRFLYSAFGFITDSTIWNLYNDLDFPLFYIDIKDVFFKSDSYVHLLLNNFKVTCVLGLLINTILFLVLKQKKKLLLFFIPYLLFVLFPTFFYFNIHHIGLMTLYLIFTFWCVCYEKHEINNSLLRLLFNVFVVFFFVIQLYWGFSSIISEVNSPYSPSRSMANYVKDNKIEKYSLWSNWTEDIALIDKHTKHLSLNNENTDNVIKEKVINLNNLYNAVLINPYFNKNIFANLNIDSPEKMYVIHYNLTDAENENLIKRWVAKGLPDFYFGNIDFSNTPVNQNEYVLLKTFEGNFIWKGTNKAYYENLYVKKDLYDEFN